jgi:hydroxyethylthiazole kinase-like uncharacterized protein yjeF
VLVIGGSRSIPGAIVLAGTAALRSGAGKLMIATARSAAVGAGIAVPEAKSVGLSENRDGAIASSAARSAAKLADDADAVLIGPGMENDPGVRSFLKSVLTSLKDRALVIDAAAIESVRKPRGFYQFSSTSIVTPHAGEMASLMNTTKQKIENDPEKWAAQASAELDAVVALKGPETVIADPSGEMFRYRGGGVGLATSGSGDVLAGVITGLLARGAPPLQAAVWGVFVHGEAGRMLSKKIARIGFLAREIADQVPLVLDAI